MALGVTLLSAASATGSAIKISGGRKNFFIYGTWGGTTAQLQWSPDGGTTWFPVVGVSGTANIAFTDIPLSPGHCRVTLTGGAAISLSAEIEDIE